MKIFLWSFLLVVVCSAQSNYGHYTSSVLTATTYGLESTLTWVPGPDPSPFDPPIQTLSLGVYFYGQFTVRVKITDPNNKRWEIPGIISPDEPIYISPYDYDFDVNYQQDPFSLTITRKSNNEVLFSSTYLYYSDRYLQWGNALAPGSNIYGLGERVWSLRFDPVETNTFSFITSDQGTPPQLPLYGSHPYYMNVVNGRAYGSFLFNSNAMDVVLGNLTLTYKTTGGIVDLWVFTGPSPVAVTQQYHSIIGHSRLPAYWALGYHQCRWGYANYTYLEAVIQQMDENNVPVDTFWVDIDYMYGWRVWTTDATLWPKAELGRIVTNLTDHGRYFVPIIDPGVKLDYNGYDVLTDGLAKNVFVRNVLNDSDYAMGKVWPGRVYFPDWTHPNTSAYWEYWTRNFSVDIPISGVWIDMNEVASFCDGRCIMDPSEDDTYTYDNSLFYCNCTERMNTSQWDNPPYVPLSIVNRQPRALSPPTFYGLDISTMSFGAQHYLDREYNLHNLYGHFEGLVSYEIMMNIRGYRPFVVSRSTFPGDGRWVTHWLGDNYSSWGDLKASITGMLTMNLFGIGMVGADVCGFGGNTTEQLCQRWMQLGVFYTFFRNHNQQGMISQEPYAFGLEILASNIAALQLRYSLIPYIYSELASMDMVGGAVLRPLVYEFPNESTTFSLDEQFMVGPALLVSPVLYENRTNVTAWFPPQNNWYDFFTGELIINETAQPRTLELDTPYDKIQVHMRGGTVLLTQSPDLTTAKQKNNNYQLHVALTSQRAQTADSSTGACNCTYFRIEPNVLIDECSDCIATGVCSSMCCFQVSNFALDGCFRLWMSDPTPHGVGGAMYRNQLQQVFDGCSIVPSYDCGQPQTANGFIYLDDGDTVDTIATQDYTLMSFVVREMDDDYHIVSYPDWNKTAFSIENIIDTIYIYGQEESQCPDKCLEVSVMGGEFLGNTKMTHNHDGVMVHTLAGISLKLSDSFYLVAECGCDSSGGLSTLAIALIVIFSILGVAIIVAMICRYQRKPAERTRLVGGEETQQYSKQLDTE
jgi:alpha-glucosidase (family GH31 glycosyl hydrolase)